MSQAGVLAGANTVFDAGVRPMAGLQERDLPTGGVGGERLVAEAVTDLEGVQGGAGVRQLAADDDRHAGTAGAPPNQVEQAGDVDDVRVLTHVAVGGARDCQPCLGTARIAWRTASVTG